MTWENYLNFVLSPQSSLKSAGINNYTVQDAVTIQVQFERLLLMAPYKEPIHILNILYQHAQNGPEKKLSLCQLQELREFFAKNPEEADRSKRMLDPFLGSLHSAYDQLLLIDLMRLAVLGDKFTANLLERKGNQSIESYREISAAFTLIREIVKKMSKELFHEWEFKQWRKQNEKEYLRLERKKETENHRYARPYIEILDSLENRMFENFWAENQWKLILAFVTHFSDESGLLPYYDYFHAWHQEMIQGAHRQIEWADAFWMLFHSLKDLEGEMAVQYLQTMRSYQELNRPLYGRYSKLHKTKENIQLEKHLAAAFYPKFGYGYGRSYAFRQSATQGSIFKLVTAYEGLVQNYRKMRESGIDPDRASFQQINPLEMVDQVYYKGKNLYVGYGPDGTPLARHYKGGRLPRSISASNGKLDLLKAIEVSSNPYFSLLAGDILSSPFDLARTAREFSYGAVTGIDLPGEIAGNIPNDLEENKTGVYSLAIGQHTLVVTPLQTALMLSALANGGKILKPKIVSMMVGKDPEHTVTGENETNDITIFSLIRHQLFLPEKIHKILIEGMCRVASKTLQNSLGSFKRLYKEYPEAVKDYQNMFSYLPGKTSTAESVEAIDLDQYQGTNLYTHVWFGGIAYEEEIMHKEKENFVFYDSVGKPELVVVVYLRYGGYGKEAAPVAAQIAKKWKEIKAQRKI